MEICYLKQKHIDRKKWDACIENSLNCMVYAMSWYLDLVCENWDALVSDDYEAVMPLPWKKKYGIKYIYHPFFAQQLGVFYKIDADDQTYEFLQAIPANFLKYETSLNFLNSAKNLSLNIRSNYILKLNQDYETIYKAFNDNTRRNIKKADKEEMILSDLTPEAFVQLKKETAVAKLNKQAYERMQQLITESMTRGVGVIYAAKNKQGEILGAVFLLRFKKRIIYLFSASNNSGKQVRVMFKLVNRIIKENAEKELLLDFEGSMIEGVARFFKGFGAQKEVYYRYKKSNIPFIR